MRALDAAEVEADPLFEGRVDTVEEMLEQHVFRRDRGVGLELEHPVSVGLLAAGQRCRGRGDGSIHSLVGNPIVHVIRRMIADQTHPFSFAVPNTAMGETDVKNPFRAEE